MKVRAILTGREYIESGPILDGQAETEEEAIRVAEDAGYAVLRGDDGGNIALHYEDRRTETGEPVRETFWYVTVVDRDEGAIERYCTIFETDWMVGDYGSWLLVDDTETRYWIYAGDITEDLMDEMESRLEYSALCDSLDAVHDDDVPARIVLRALADMNGIPRAYLPETVDSDADLAEILESVSDWPIRYESASHGW